MPEVFKYPVREMRCQPISRTEHLNTSAIPSHGTDSFCIKTMTPGHPIPNISPCLTSFWRGNWKTEFVKTIHRQEGTSSEKKSDGLPKKCSIELWTILLFELLLIHQRSAWNERSINYWKSIVKHYWFQSGLHQKNSINFQYLWRKNIEGFLVFVKVIAKKNRDIFVGHPVYNKTLPKIPSIKTMEFSLLY